VADFRPGLPLQDFRADYMLGGEDSAMTVVGHVEQLHLSRCYQDSKTLSCLTCHDPHSEPTPRERLAYYKAVCLECHQVEQCKVSEARRRQESPENNCVRCHMPSAPTEIPHLAFTHHRIGIHGRPDSGKGKAHPALALLRPVLELPPLGDADRKRSLGLGYLEAANREKDARQAEGFRERALSLLTAGKALGLRDAALEAGLGRLRFDLDLEGVLPCAQAALASPDVDAQDRCNALFLVADSHAAAGRHADAAAALDRLTGLRRHPTDWLLLADCRRQLGEERAAQEALTRAVRIDPRLWKVHQHLAEHSRRAGDAERAAWHQRRAVP
jgi:predicted CXXCH cytochrome family protein